MTVKIQFSEEEKKTLIAAFDLLQQYRRHDTSSGAEYLKTLSLVNHMSEFIDKTCMDN